MRPTTWVSDFPFMGLCRWFCFSNFGWFFSLDFGFVLVVVVGCGGVVVGGGVVVDDGGER